MTNIQIEELCTDLSPYEIFRRLHKHSYPAFLDSCSDFSKLGRHSILGIDPFMMIKAKVDKVEVQSKNGTEIIKTDPFEFMKSILEKYTCEGNSDIPFTGGAIGYLSYDLGRNFEKLPSKAIDDSNIPDLILGLYDIAIVFDNLENRAYIIMALVDDVSEKERQEKLKSIKYDIVHENLLRLQESDVPYQKNKTSLKSNFTKNNYCKAIEKIKEYLRQGDIYEVNMTQRFSTPINRHPYNIYKTLRDNNPAPFAAYLDYGNLHVLSSSPERFLKKAGDYVETRPIKGTMPRGEGNLDLLNEKALANSIKNKAENLMIVDLMRNDLGRVCNIGSISVPELFTVEKYATVFQMVSTVTGTAKKGIDAFDILSATFPGGSITGAPKIRSMEIIEELEPTRRNIYTGCIGYIGFDGNMDLNIAIRTIVIKDQQAYYQVGGGIVWDSDPESEYQETLDKGYALKRTLLNNN